ncbi:12659_t:CDS:2 [Ambispora gerdemannii]|uniref:12659_t:CDS:1 n=1 Tax=Ambispora gerdemannii TaxID=144530 RepID=A0A9N9BGH3_9GLOM|nr:12659_t:CDS:2 [Ambispora gerdemannii]
MEYQVIASFVNNSKSRAFRNSNLDNLDNDVQPPPHRSPNSFDLFSHGSEPENPMMISSTETNHQNLQEQKGASSQEPIVISSDDDDNNHHETDEESGLFSPDPINRTYTNDTTEGYFSFEDTDNDDDLENVLFGSPANRTNETETIERKFNSLLSHNEGSGSISNSNNNFFTQDQNYEVGGRAEGIKPFSDKIEDKNSTTPQTSSKLKTLSNKRKNSSEFQTSRVMANGNAQSGIIPFRYDEVVRNKKERRQLMAVSCPDCSKYFEMTSSTQLPDYVKPVCRHPNKTNDNDNSNNSDTTKNDRIQLLSRHRQRFSRAPTPPGFWTIGFPSLSDEEKRKKELEEYKRRREARKLTEDEWERSRKRRNTYRNRVYGSHISKNYKSSSSK